MGGGSWAAPSAGATAAFLCVVGLVVAAMIAAVRKASPRHVGVFTVGALVWLGLTALPSLTGLARVAPAALIGFFVVSNGAALVFALSPLGARLTSLPLGALVAFQAFRLPLELVLHRWWTEGAIPVQMTFEGHNFDIVTGALATLLGLWSLHGPLPRGVAWGFNAIGGGLLLAVMTIAVLSSPVPLRAYGGEPLVLGLYFPYAWIVPFCVAPALAGHVILLRKMIRREGKGAPDA